MSDCGNSAGIRCGGLCIELSGDLVGSWVREENLPFLGVRGRQGPVPDGPASRVFHCFLSGLGELEWHLEVSGAPPRAENMWLEVTRMFMWWTGTSVCECGGPSGLPGTQLCDCECMQASGHLGPGVGTGCGL